jgi:hypothetical protein
MTQSTVVALEFMDCLNAAGLRHLLGVIPTAEDVTSCYDPIYGSGAGDEGGGVTQDDGNEGTAGDGGESMSKDEEISGSLMTNINLNSCNRSDSPS